MEGSNVTSISETELRRLEKRIDELIRACGQLQEENQSLRTRQEALIAERAELIEKTELAYGRIETMIARLKSLEQAP